MYAGILPDLSTAEVLRLNFSVAGPINPAPSKSNVVGSGDTAEEAGRSDALRRRDGMLRRDRHVRQVQRDDSASRAGHPQPAAAWPQRARCAAHGGADDLHFEAARAVRAPAELMAGGLSAGSGREPAPAPHRE